MSDRMLDLAMYLLDAATKRLEQATEMYKRNDWFDGYFVGIWGHALRIAGNCVGDIAICLDKEGQ